MEALKHTYLFSREKKNKTRLKNRQKQNKTNQKIIKISSKIRPLNK